MQDSASKDMAFDLGEENIRNANTIKAVSSITSMIIDAMCGSLHNQHFINCNHWTLNGTAGSKVAMWHNLYKLLKCLCTTAHANNHKQKMNILFDYKEYHFLFVQHKSSPTWCARNTTKYITYKLNSSSFLSTQYFTNYQQLL